MEMQSAAYLRQAHRVVGHELLAVSLDQAALSDEKLRDIWNAYDIDGSNTLDRTEVLALLEDLQELAKGHRHVPPEAFEAVFGAMDRDSSGEVDFDEFLQHGRQVGLSVTWV